MIKKYTKGFTLIELLVVIAIIGILSSVVLVSLNTARNKGTDAKVQSQLGGMRSAAEIVYSNNVPGAYGTAVPADATCPATSGSLTANADIIAYKAGMPASGASLRCGVSADRQAYAIGHPLIGTGVATDWWCVDSAGNSGKITVTTIGTVAVTDSTCALMAN